MHSSGWKVDERAQYDAFGYKQTCAMLMIVISQLQYIPASYCERLHHPVFTIALLPLRKYTMELKHS